MRVLPGGFVPPCLPTKAKQPPSGPLWWHEIKHDGFRVIARKIGNQVRLYSRPGNDLTYRFPLIVEALAKLRSRSCRSMFLCWRNAFTIALGSRGSSAAWPIFLILRR
jgi:ATP dependent DNA ligase-like protein